MSEPTTAEILKASKEGKAIRRETSTSTIAQAAKTLDGRTSQDRVVVLLQEYTAKLESLAAEAISLREAFLRNLHSSDDEAKTQLESKEFLQQILAERISGLDIPIRNLSRVVSQLIDNGKLSSTIERVELEVRLADLEGALNAANNLVHHPFPRWKRK